MDYGRWLAALSAWNVYRIRVVVLLTLTLAVLAVASSAHAPAPPVVPWQGSPNVSKIASDNPDDAIVRSAVRGVVAQYKKPFYAPPHMAEPVQLGTPALARLFPNYRFYLIGWDTVAGPMPEGRMVNTARGLYFTIVVPPHGDPVTLGGFGNFEAFGTLLNRAGVKIRSPEDAALVWTAFKDAHQKNWSARKTNRRVSPTEWALGEELVGTDRYRCRVTLDASQTVTSTRMVVEDMSRRTLTR